MQHCSGTDSATSQGPDSDILQESVMPTPGEPLDGFHYVPIRALSDRHRARMAAHMLALNASDRYLRFGYLAGDDQIRRYVDHIDFDLDEVFGVFNRKLELIALAHLACDPVLPGRDGARSAEFGVSVAPHARGRGYGSRLFEHAVLRARARGIDTLVIHALTENAAMLAIVRRAGGVVEEAGPESEGRLALPPDDEVVRQKASMTQRVGELDYQFKLGVRRAQDGLRTS